jgi:hypothetical protein
MTAEELRSLLAYDAETGVLRWVSRSAICLRAGDVAGHKNRSGYREIKIAYRAYLAHRLVWLHVHGEWPKGQIDHINGNRDDNRIANLRDVSSSQNMLNRHKAPANVIGFPGLYMKRGRYGARLIVNGKQKYLGVYDTAEEAHAAYQQHKALHSGLTQQETPEQRRIRELEARLEAAERKAA